LTWAAIIPQEPLAIHCFTVPDRRSVNLYGYK
jgi:hypothetical protein